MHGGVGGDSDEAARAKAAAAVAARAEAADRTHEVVILGAGMSGLCMAIALRRAGIDDFVVIEKSPGLGGTWWDNRYPGAQVDVPAPLYSFSFEPNPRWRQRFAAAPEIQAYMAHCARKYGIGPHLRLGRRITEATFDEAGGRWLIDCDDGQRLRARHFVCSTGPLSQPRWPEIPGLQAFDGPRLHTARWDAGVPLQGRRVAVIGTGSTAAQLVPAIAPQLAHLGVYQRTANWVLPRLDRRYRAADRALARLPPYAAAVRAFWYHALEWGRRGFDEGRLARRGMLATAAAHLERQVPDPVLRERLRPPHALGCKRLIYSNDYYPALARPQTELVTEAIERVTPRGLVTADGRERPYDVLVCATGFDVAHLAQALPVTGRGGRRLANAWRDGAQAWHGTMVAGFPNLYFLLGPNTATGHTSTLLYIEPEVRFALRAMQRVQREGRRWIEVRDAAMREHNQALQARLAGSVWAGCRSWYRQGDDGRIVALWPGFTGEYVRALERADGALFELG
ncbi:MAG: NAD(P)/FAD-dependent oxidoreductase [Burkholderiales bacterium]|nr:NAD(P)/FAD-dependent oxidoreductase [Burkholderiales bacterium]